MAKQKKFEEAKILFKETHQHAERFTLKINELLKHLSDFSQEEFDQFHNDFPDIERIDEVLSILEKSKP